MNDETVHLPIEPLVDYLNRVQRELEGDFEALANYCGVSSRGLSRYVTLDQTRRVSAKSTIISLRYADEILTNTGDEAVASLWNTEDLDVNYRLPEAHTPKCKRCHIEMRKKAQLCGFCVEETTGKTLTYRVREYY